jgi:hypothetical protein
MPVIEATQDRPNGLTRKCVAGDPDLDRLVEFTRSHDSRLDLAAAVAKLAQALACDPERWPRKRLRVLNRGRLLVTLQRSVTAARSRHIAAAIEAGVWRGWPLPAIDPLTTAEGDYALAEWAKFVGRLRDVGVNVDRDHAVRRMTRSEQLVRSNHRRRVESALALLSPGAPMPAWLALLRAKEALHETDACPNVEAAGELRVRSHMLAAIEP